MPIEREKTYKYGEILTDLKFKEVFVFSSSDDFVLNEEPKRFRLATEEEKKALGLSFGKSIIYPLADTEGYKE